MTKYPMTKQCRNPKPEHGLKCAPHADSACDTMVRAKTTAHTGVVHGVCLARWLPLCRSA